jgi:hypothetical protein
MSSALVQQFSQLHLSEDLQEVGDIPDGILYGIDAEFERIIALKEGIPSARNVREEVYYVLKKQLQNSLPLIPLERSGGRRTIDVFAMGQYTGGIEDTFSITCEASRNMMYLNVRINNPPTIGEKLLLDEDNEPEIPLILTLMSGNPPQSVVERKHKDRSGRTVFQFPFHVERDTADRILEVIHELLCHFPTPEVAGDSN